jgi:hypothetical protein
MWRKGWMEPDGWNQKPRKWVCKPPDCRFLEIWRSGRPTGALNSRGSRYLHRSCGDFWIWPNELELSDAFLRKAKCPLCVPPITFSEGQPRFDDSDEAVFLALGEQPFASIRQLPGLTHLPRTTGYRWLMQSLDDTCAVFDVFPIACQRLKSQIGLNYRSSFHPCWRFSRSHALWYHHFRWVVVLCVHWSSHDLARGRRKSARKGAAHRSVKKPDADDRLESQRLWFDQCSFQRIQVQREPLRNQYSWSLRGLAQSSGGWVEAKTDHRWPPIRHGLISQEWRNNFWSNKQWKKPFHLTYSPDLAPSDFYRFSPFYLFCLFSHLDGAKQLFAGDEISDGAGIEKMTFEPAFLTWTERLRHRISKHLFISKELNHERPVLRCSYLGQTPYNSKNALIWKGQSSFLATFVSMSTLSSKFNTKTLTQSLAV